ncbi:hypothetical protein E2C01_056554 [Portunus trituberculatus]|uniref:Uncharacterized protein n=1 Tax=Portunus trituberculatus TaxID=210409 RepID=A0A5B7GXZ7_PORTR|nr:hypothetical protein [Portunus trituberculatus]
MGPRESNFGTVAGLHETLTWRVHEMVAWKAHDTMTWKGRWRGVEQGNKQRSLFSSILSFGSKTL